MAILSGSISKEFEIWKDIVGYEGLYQTSNSGRVKSLKRYVPHFKGGLKVVPERMKTIFYQKDGRPRVGLSKGNLNRKSFVYRLVAQAFIPNPNNYLRVSRSCMTAATDDDNRKIKGYKFKFI